VKLTSDTGLHKPAGWSQGREAGSGRRCMLRSVVLSDVLLQKRRLVSIEPLSRIVGGAALALGLSIAGNTFYALEFLKVVHGRWHEPTEFTDRQEARYSLKSTVLIIGFNHWSGL
jgi:hypothetical protein